MTALRGVTKTKADRAAMILLASVLMRDRVRCTLVQMGAPDSHESIVEALAKREVCLSELGPWLEGKGNEGLLKMPCLAEGETAATELLINEGK